MGYSEHDLQNGLGCNDNSIHNILQTEGSVFVILETFYMLMVQWHLEEPGVYMSPGDTHFAPPTGWIFGETSGSMGFGLVIWGFGCKVYDLEPSTQFSTPQA